MKKLSILALAAVGLLLGACSDKNEVVQESPIDPGQFENGAYIGITLSLPSADNNVTRANDDLSNGIAAEFAVKNATLYIFRASTSETNEGNAVFVRSVALGTTYRNDTQGGITNDEWGVQSGVGTKPVDETDANTEGETNISQTSLSEATKIPATLAATIKGDNSNKYYAYVIINHNAQIQDLTSVLDDESNATKFSDFSKRKFDKIGADIALEQNIHSTGMLMTNAPICSVHGGNEAPSSPTYSTLVLMENKNIFSSAAQAKKAPAACVYVERAAVKITVEEGSGVASSTIDGYSVVINGWKVINTEPYYYNTRQINLKSTEQGETAKQWQTENWGGYTNSNATPGAAKYRFVSAYQFLPTLPQGLVSMNWSDPDNPTEGTYTHTVGYRTYFAADPHYDFDCLATNGGTPSTLNYTTADDGRPWITTGKHAYTTENTFDVQHQTWRNTTMVTIKASLKDASNNNPDFYTVGKGSQTMYTSTDDVEAVLHNLIMNDPAVASAVQNLLRLISLNNQTQTVNAGIAVNLTAPGNATTGVTFTAEPAFTLGTGSSATAATYTGTSATSITDTTDPIYGKSEAQLKTALETAIANYIHPTESGSLVTTKYKDPVLVSFYKAGAMYYNVKIQHFGEAETPWGGNDVVEDGTGVDVNEIYFNTLTGSSVSPANYENGQKKFLGRYGVVRDNWYKLTLDAVTKIGSATPEDPSLITPDTPDDEIENYISVHVHIVPWVLRSQSVIL